MPPQIQSASSTPSTASSTAASPQTSTTPVLGEDDFLKLLTQQMQYQDPMDPMSGTEFASQLAQFSSVEELTNINTELGQSISANSVLTQSINNDLAATFIGKNVQATTNTFTYSGTGTTELGYNLPSAASTVTVNISDGSGNVVKTIQSAPTGNGDQSFTWDGTNDAGNQVGSGTYTFSVQATDSTWRIDHRVAVYLRNRLGCPFQFHRHGVRDRWDGSSAFRYT